MKRCEHIQDILAEGGLAGLTAEDRQHLDSCPECAAFAAALSELDSAFSDLTPHEPPPRLVAETVARARRRERTPFRLPVWQVLRFPSARAMAAAFTIILAVAFSLKSDTPWRKTRRFAASEAGAPAQQSEAYNDLTSTLQQDLDESRNSARETRKALNELEEDMRDTNQRTAEILGKIVERTDDMSRSIDGLAGSAKESREALKDATPKLYEEETFQSASNDISSGPSDSEGASPPAVDAGRMGSSAGVYDGRDVMTGERPRTNGDKFLEQQEAPAAKPDSSVAARKKSELSQPQDAIANLGAGVNAPPPGMDYPAELKLKRQETKGAKGMEDAKNFPAPASPAKTRAIRYQDPSGYWANTYLPGSSREKYLERILKSGAAGTAHDLAKPLAQPFDVPAHSALGLQLSADRLQVEGETRLLVQVGLKGAERSAARRSALNLGVVLSLDNPQSPDSQQKVRAVLESLAKSIDTGDRFQLFIPGQNKLEAKDFKWGPIQVALEELFKGTSSVTPTDAAFADAAAAVIGSDSPEAVLGSSALLFVTDSGDVSEQIRQLATSAAAGAVSTSVIDLSPGTDEALETLALRGHGRHYELAAPAGAEELVAKELTASTRAVARAVRLNIKLAPGVKLVDVLGSRRLDAQSAAVEKRAESAIDRRIAQTLGIKSDRGEDQEGIQILIPAFYSADTHAILLDVVVPGPGPVLDVRATFKDLIELKNNTVNGSFATIAGEAKTSRLENSVSRSFYTARVSALLGDTARALRAGSPGALTQYRQRANEIEQFRLATPGLARDAALISDTQLISQFESAIALAHHGRIDRLLLSDSLELASIRKRL